MKEEGDVFKKFRDSFSRMEGHFHILGMILNMVLGY